MQLFKKKAYTLYFSDGCDNCIPNDVIIGTQTWTGCNLNVTTYRDGTTIPQVTDPTAWAALTTGAWCYYENDTANGPVYGKLYNWYAINDPRGLAPTGYHVPSDTEWTTLTDFLGGESVAGGKLKEVGLCHWLSPNTDATNTSLFTALPGGAREYDGVYSTIGLNGNWWSSTETGTNTAWARNINNGNGNAYRTFADKNAGQAVRLVQDVVTPTPIDFYLNQICSGVNVAYIRLDDITGGTAPYYPANVTFSSEAAALATTDWSLTPNNGSTAVNYPETVTGEYWVAVKDSTGDILVKDIYADCWSISANRELGYRSTLGNTSSSTTCGYSTEAGSNNLYVAVHTPYTLAVGDRVFLSGLPGTAVFDGTSGIPDTPKYWKLGLNTQFDPCTGDGAVARINKYGVIEDLICCP